MSKLIGLTELAEAMVGHIMTSAEKAKLAGIEAGANNYTLPKATAGTLGGIKVGRNLTITDDGILSAVRGEEALPVASESTLGCIKVGSNLSIDGSGVLSATDTTYAEATDMASGLMSASDKAKLDSASTDYTDTGSNVLTTAKALADAYTALAALIQANLTYTVAETCPAVADAADNTVYLVPDAGRSTCTEYLKITVDSTSRMEVIGSTGITVDNAITSGGQNPVKGGAIYDALAGKQATLTAGANITIASGIISATDTTYSNATQSAAGLMSAADKTTVDGIDYATQAEIEAAFGLQSVSQGE